MTKEKPFEKQTKAEKRVTIARDVLSQLDVRLIATEGVWVGSKDSRRLPIGKDINAEVCSLTRKQKKCEVCGIGALFVASVERADKLKVSALEDLRGLEMATPGDFTGISESDCFDYLKRFFDDDQLDAIESAFERGEGTTHHDSRDFAAAVDNAADRMRLIMENIVANKGRFKWHRSPVATWSTPGFTP